MKTTFYSLIILLSVVLISCEDYSAETPSVESIEIVEQIDNADGSVTVTFLFKCNSRDDVVVWWGTEESNYQSYLDYTANSGSNEENLTADYPKGESLQDPKNWNGENTFEKVYPISGSYDLVVVATNIGDFTDDIKQIIHKETIQIQ